jgi:hypothetical protein
MKHFMKLGVVLLLGAVLQNVYAQPTVRVLTVVDIRAGVNATSFALAEVAKTNNLLSQNSINLRVANAGAISADLDQGIGVYMDQDLQASTVLGLVRDNASIIEFRDIANADVVMTVYKTRNNEGTAFGFPARSPDLAFAIVHPASTTVNELGYQQELMHLFGATHQSAGGKQGDQSGGQAWYLRAYTYTLNGSFVPYCDHTVMAYEPLNNLGGISCTSGKVGYFSDPSRCITSLHNVNRVVTTYCYGDGSHNNKRVIELTGPSLVGFGQTDLLPALKRRRAIRTFNSIWQSLFGS